MFTQKKNTLSRSVYVPPSYIVAGTRAGTLYRWEIPEKFEEEVLYPPHQITKHIGVISALHWSQSTKLLISGSADRKVICWKMDSRVPPEEPFQVICLFEETPLYITTYLKFLFILETRGITVLSLQTIQGKVASTTEFRKIEFIGHPSHSFTSLCFYPNPSVDNSGYLYAGFANGTILQYDVQLADKPTFTASTAPKQIGDRAIFRIIYVPGEAILLLFSYDAHVRIFNTRNYRVTNILKNPRNVDYISGCFEARSKQYLFADTDGFLYVWEVEDLQRILLQTQFHTRCDDLVPEESDRFLFLQREGVSLIDINRGTVKVSYNIHNGTAFYMTQIHDSTKKLLATAGDDKYIRFWDPSTYKARLEHKVPTHLVMLSVYVGVKIRPKTNLIWAVTGHDEGKLYFFNITDSKHAELPSRHRNSIASISVVQQEMKVLLFSCDYDGFVSVWSIDSILENLSYAAVSLIKIFKASDREILASAGQWIGPEMIMATGGNDKVINLWHENEGVYTSKPLVGHTDSVTSLVFDGFFLLSGSEDLTVRIWDTINLVQIMVINNVHQNAIRSIFLIENESKFASCDNGGMVVIYDFIKRIEMWKVKHSHDCKCVFVDTQAQMLYACVKSELIPHELPPKLFADRLPSLTSSANLISSRFLSTPT